MLMVPPLAALPFAGKIYDDPNLFLHRAKSSSSKNEFEWTKRLNIFPTILPFPISDSHLFFVKGKVSRKNVRTVHTALFSPKSLYELWTPPSANNIPTIVLHTYLSLHETGNPRAMSYWSSSSSFLLAIYPLWKWVSDAQVVQELLFQDNFDHVKRNNHSQPENTPLEYNLKHGRNCHWNQWETT